MKNQFKIVIGIYLAALLLGVITGCTKEKCVVCPPNPPPAEKEYHFLYSYGAYNWVYTYSTKTGQIVDSVKYPSYPFMDVRFSKDGRYAYYAGDASIWITDFATGDTVAITQNYGGWLSLSSDEKYLFVSNSTVVMLLEIPSLTVVYQREHRNSWANGTVNPLKNIAYVGNNAIDSLLIIDFRTSAIRDSMIPLSNGQGTPISALSVAITNDGKFMIVGHGQLRDAQTLELLREFPHGASLGPYFHPDGERVFFLEYGDIDIGQQGEVWELNLRTFWMTRILLAEDFVAYLPYFAFSPNDMDFTSDGKYAFIINGGAGNYFGMGAILKLNCDTYKIVDAIYPSQGISNRIRINPREIKAGE